jgi:hypothetical protein
MFAGWDQRLFVLERSNPRQSDHPIWLTTVVHAEDASVRVDCPKSGVRKVAL